MDVNDRQQISEMDDGIGRQSRERSRKQILKEIGMGKQKKFVFTGGGTGGHVTPALAIAEGIRAKYPEARFYYVGLRGKAEDGMVQKAWKTEMEKGLASLHFVSTTSGSLKSPRVLLTLGLGFLQALFFLLRTRPAAIVGTGGYVSAPIIFATAFLRTIKLSSAVIFLHEANAELGKMNKAAIRFAQKVGFSFPGTKIPESKKAFVGYPVRSSVVVNRDADQNQLKKEARDKLNIPQDAKVLFAFGGSQGARTINRGLVAALPLLLKDPKVWIIHGTGRQLKGNSYHGLSDVQAQLEKLKGQLPADWESRYQPTDFIYNMGEVYAATDLVICRSGAGSLYEVCANGVAAITIPKANLTGDHQAVNARTLERLEAMKVIYERVDVADSQTIESIDPAEFSELVFALLADPEQRKIMIRNAMAQYEPNTSANCALIVANLLGDDELPSLKDEPRPQKERILGRNSAQLERLLRQVRRGEELLSAEERRIALYKIDGWAANRGLVMPARACRMIGEGQFVERLDVLKRFALDQSKSPFTRRDAFVGLRRMGRLDLEIIGVCLEGTKDSYFETVNDALKTLASLLRSHRAIFIDQYARIKTEVQPLASSKEFDIRMHALAVLTEICTDFSEIESSFQKNYFHPNWQVRRSIISCFGVLIERGILEQEHVQRILQSEFLQTSNGFQMRFLLKEEMRDIFQQEPRSQFATNFRTTCSEANLSLQKLEALLHQAEKDRLVWDIKTSLREVIGEGQ